MKRRVIMRLLPPIALLISVTASAGVGDANSWRDDGIGSSGSWWGFIFAVIFVFGALAGGGNTMMIGIAFIIGATLAQWFGGVIGILGCTGFLVWIYRTIMPSASKEKLSNEQPSSIVIDNDEQQKAPTILKASMPKSDQPAITVAVRCDCGKSHSMAADWRGVLRCDICGRLHRLNLDQFARRQAKKP